MNGVPDALFQQQTTVIQEDYSLSEPVAPEPPAGISPIHLDSEGRIPAGAPLRRKRIRTTQHLPEAELVLVNAADGCALYRVRFRCEETLCLHLLVGTMELLFAVRLIGSYSLERYYYACPDRPIQRTRWTDDVSLAPDADGSTEESERLRREIEGGETVAPPTLADLLAGRRTLQPGDPPVCLPSDEVPRLVAASSYSTPYQEGDHRVLKQTILLREGPAQVEDCFLVVTYQQAVREERWTIPEGRTVPNYPRTDFFDPPIYVTMRWRIPGCR